MPCSLENKTKNMLDMLHLGGENLRIRGGNTIFHIDVFPRISTSNTVQEILIRRKCCSLVHFPLSLVPTKGWGTVRPSYQRNKIKGKGHKKPPFLKATNCRVTLSLSNTQLRSGFKGEVHEDDEVWTPCAIQPQSALAALSCSRPHLPVGPSIFNHPHLEANHSQQDSQMQQIRIQEIQLNLNFRSAMNNI